MKRESVVIASVLLAIRATRFLAYDLPGREIGRYAVHVRLDLWTDTCPCFHTMSIDRLRENGRDLKRA